MDDSIWDAPLAQDSPERAASGSSRAKGGGGDHDSGNTPSRPTKRARQSLFLASDSDNDDGANAFRAGPSSRSAPANKPPPAQDLDIEKLFEDIDDDDVEMSKPLPALVDEEELTRRAEAKYKRINKEKELTLHQIMPSSSPGRESDPETGGKKGKRKEKGDEKKARRRQLKLDENLLVGPSGFPQLVKMTKNFRIKGKGHEAADLDRLLKIYQYWTHQLYPKTTFSDTVERVEKLCHTRRMNVSMSVWRDEAHGKPIRSQEDEDGDDIDNEEGAEDENQLQTLKQANNNENLPPSSPVRSSSRGSSPPTHAHTPNVDDDDEEFWKSLDMGLAGAGTGVNGSQSDGAPAPPASSGAPSDMDEDEDMWDIVNQIEKETSAGKDTSGASGVAAGPLPQNQPPDDDWDDMYV